MDKYFYRTVNVFAKGNSPIYAFFETLHETEPDAMKHLRATRIVGRVEYGPWIDPRDLVKQLKESNA